LVPNRSLPSQTLAATSCLAFVWFYHACSCHTSLIIWPNYHRVNFLANFCQSLASNFLATLCGSHTLPNFGLANYGWEPNRPPIFLATL
jgi:hypothetical protein